MDHTAGVANGAQHPAEPAGLADVDPAHPALPDRTDSGLPPHLRASVTDVPVTPGIDSEAYNSEADVAGTNGHHHHGGAHQSEPGYFSRHDVDHAIAASPAPNTTNVEGQSFQSKVDTGAQEGTNFLRRLSLAVMQHPLGALLASPSKESMSEIRALSPDLALTGNIISATFNIPNQLKYRKGADWVCLCSFPFFSLPFSLCISLALAPNLRLSFPWA